MTVHLQEKIKVAGHLYEKRGIYQMCLSWPLPDGSRGRLSRSTGLTVKGNKKRAEELLKKLIREQQELLSTKAVGAGMLFADFMEHWLKNVIKKEVRITTFGGYQYNVLTVISPYFRERRIRLCDLTEKDVEAFYDAQLHRGVKATTVHKFHTNISKALKYAVKEKILRHTVMSMVQRPKKERYVAKYLRQSEMLKLFEAVRGEPLEFPVIMGAFYGLRRAEIAGLKWQAIDFDANCITIEHTITTTSVDGKRIEIAEDTTKSKKSMRSLPLIPAFRHILLEMKEGQEAKRKLYGSAYCRKDLDYIYKDALGYRIGPESISRRFPAFLEKNGIKRVRFHDLRHSCASLLIANGVPLIQVSAWLGHSEIGITAEFYAHLEFESKIESANAMTWINDTSFAQEALPGKDEPLLLEGSATKNNQPIHTK